MHSNHLKKLIATEYTLFSLETMSVEKTVSDFRPLVREGKAVYQWQNNVGLSRIEASHIHLPNTKTPEMVLKYIKQNKLYGIYLLMNFNQHLSNFHLQPILQQLANADMNHNSNNTIMIDTHFNYPQNLLSKLLITQEPNVKTTQIL
jgi:hypothetical protein